MQYAYIARYTGFQSQKSCTILQMALSEGNCLHYLYKSKKIYAKTCNICRTQSQALHDILQSQGSNPTHITYPGVSHADFAIGWKVASLGNLSFLYT